MIFNPFRSVYATSTASQHTDTPRVTHHPLKHLTAQPEHAACCCCLLYQGARAASVLVALLSNAAKFLVCPQTDLLQTWLHVVWANLKLAFHRIHMQDCWTHSSGRRPSFEEVFPTQTGGGWPFQDPALADCLQPQLSRDRLVLKALRSPPHASSPSAPFTWLLRGCSLGISNFAKMLEVCY